MPRRAAAPAADALAAAKRGSNTGSIAANDTAAQELAERRKLARAAAAWAFENKVGSKAALKDEQFKGRGLTYNMVQPLLKELKAGGTKRRVDAPRDHHCQVLTNDERIKLAHWILACAAGQNPKDRTAVSAKVKEMLRARHASNKRRKSRAGCIRLNDQEVAVKQSQEPRLAHTFFQRFYPWCRAHGIEIEEGVERSQDVKRAAKMTEATVERHFHGEFGLEAELIDAGIMDPETKVGSYPHACEHTCAHIDRALHQGPHPGLLGPIGETVDSRGVSLMEGVLCVS